jgi:tetratricopeptide (TPR) repeat protein
MRFKRILWVLAAFGFCSVLFAQAGQAPGGPTQSQDPAQPVTHCPELRSDYTNGDPVTQTQVQMQAQALLHRQLEDYTQGLVLMTEKGVTKEIKSAPAETVIKDVNEGGVDFDMTPGIEKKLRRANATDEVIEAVRQAGPKVRAQMAKMILGPGPAGVLDIPKEQARGFSAIMSALDPVRTIALVGDFAKKYPNSPLLSYVYSVEANAYQQKGDLEKVVECASKSLALKPDNLASLISRLGILPLPQYLRSHVADRGKILQEAESDASRALQLISQIPKQSNEGEAEYRKRLAGFASEVHGPLGMVHLELASGGLAGLDKAELVKAEQELKTAVTTSSHPDPRDYYRMGEAYVLDGKWDDAMQAFKKAGGLGQGTLIKTYADEEIAQVKKRKAQDSVASNRQ